MALRVMLLTVAAIARTIAEQALALVARGTLAVQVVTIPIVAREPMQPEIAQELMALRVLAQHRAAALTTKPTATLNQVVPGRPELH